MPHLLERQVDVRSWLAHVHEHACDSIHDVCYGACGLSSAELHEVRHGGKHNMLLQLSCQSNLATQAYEGCHMPPTALTCALKWYKATEQHMSQRI